MSKQHDAEREKQKQVALINKMASRLPWIMLAIFLFAFLIIFLQAYFKQV